MLGEEIEASQMFGKPCLKFRKKAFLAHFKGDMVFKLEKEELAGLLIKYPGSQNWDPSGKGRAMKEWLQVPSEFSKDYTHLAQNALVYLKKSL